MAVGVLVGVEVGVEVGVLVGVEVGVDVGVSVGVEVGVSVGVGVAISPNTGGLVTSGSLTCAPVIPGDLKKCTIHEINLDKNPSSGLEDSADTTDILMTSKVKTMATIPTIFSFSTILHSGGA